MFEDDNLLFVAVDNIFDCYGLIFSSNKIDVKNLWNLIDCLHVWKRGISKDVVNIEGVFW